MLPRRCLDRGDQTLNTFYMKTVIRESVHSNARNPGMRIDILPCFLQTKAYFCAQILKNYVS